MIITCINCAKKFDVDPSVIPEIGRLVQCNGCNHKWFFKKPILKENLSLAKSSKLGKELKTYVEQVKSTKTESPENIELLDNQVKNDHIEEKILIKEAEENNSYNKNSDFAPVIINSKNKKNPNILGLIVVFILSFIAIIIVIDTFQEPISKIVPNIEFLLYNLYETINDIELFLKDLI